MINVSKEFLELMQTRTDFKQYADITFVDGTTLTLEAKDFTIGNNSVNETSDSDSLPFGASISRKIKICLMNNTDQFSTYDFVGAKIRLYLKYELSTTTETINFGTFTVTDPETYGVTITITAYDDMYKADKPYTTGLYFPQTAGAMLRDICTTCGISLYSATFRNDNYVITSKPDGNYTCRQVIGWIAMIAGGNARINRSGSLEIISYDFSKVSQIIDGGTFEPWTQGDSYDGGSFNPWTTGDVLDGGSFGDRKNIHVLHAFKNLTVDTDDIVITGVSMKEDEDTVLYGEEGYLINVENPLVTDKRYFVQLLGDVLIGARFRKFSGDHIAYPLAEAMDLAIVLDRKGNAYSTIITDVNFVFFGFTTLKNSAASAIRNSSKYNSQSVQTYVKSKELIEKQKTEFEKSIESLNSLIENSPGAYMTKIQTESGGTITYLHNHPTIEESDMIWEMTAEGWRVSDNGGETWVAGMKVNGEVIAQILTAIGVNADWINSGAIVVKDSDGNVKFSVDIDTDAVFVNGSVIQIGNKPLETALADALKEANQYSDDSFTQEKVLNALTNNGQAKGIYLQDGQLYISFTYAKGGYLDLGGVNNEKGVFRIFNNSGTLVGIIENGQLKLSANINNANNPEISLWEQGLQVDINGTVYAGLQFLPISGSSGTTITPVLTGYDSFRIDSKKAVGSTSYPYTFIRGDITSNGGILRFPTDVKCYKTLQVNTMETNTNAANVYWNPYDTYFYRSTSSSERYKDIDRVLTDEDVENLYDIEVYLAKYKDDYLSKNDERYQKYMPMFTVENIEKYLPIAVNHNPDGSPEMWNSQIFMAVLFQMTKSQKNKIDALQNEITELKNLLSMKGVI